MYNSKNIPLIQRDISWLSFNYRVLQEAKNPDVPLLERIKFLGIYSSNLDEFFRVRVAAIKTLIRLGKKTKKEMAFSPESVLESVRKTVTEQQLEFDSIYKDQIIPALQKHNIYIVRPKDLQAQHLFFLDNFYEETLIQHLQPVLLVKDKIRTFLRSNALYLAVKLKTEGQNNRYAVIRIPSHKFARFIELPSQNSHKKEIIILDDIVRYCLPYMFPGYEVEDAFSIKMTRDADIYIEDEYSGNLVEKIKKGIAKRTIGKGTRFVFDRKMPEGMLDFLVAALHIKEDSLQPEGRYHNNFDFFKFPKFGLQNLQDVPLPPLQQKALHHQPNIFSVIDQKDQMLHFPYQKYEYLLRWLEQAAHDPLVTEIKVIQYRLAKDSRIIAALRSAIQDGKKVTVFMEVKARFDEEANLYWAERLESWGAKVMYSIPELKVHAKLLLITRQGKNYAYLSTGNFNEDTAKVYSDFGLFTADTRLTKEIATVFTFLENHKRPEKPFHHLLMGQFGMRRSLYQLIDQEIKNAKAGKFAQIILKLNSIQDPRIIARLYEASNAGVKIKMNIRGICSLVPGQPGYSENIEVVSIIDRFLEHTRVYLFHNDGDEKIYLSSADWMTRNLFYRIECVFPIYDEDLKQEIKDFLEIQFQDNVKTRIIDAKQTNAFKRDENPPMRSQHLMYEYYKNKLK